MKSELFLPFRTIKKSNNKLHLLIIIICLNLMNVNLIKCLERKTTTASSNGDDDYGIYHNIANIISSQQSIKHQTNNHLNQSPDFRPSNWTGVSLDRLRKMKRSENYDKFRRYQEYNKYLRSKTADTSNDDDTSNSNYNNYQFRRRSDLDDDYYFPSYYSSANPYGSGIVYSSPPAVQPVLSLPPSTVLGTSPTYYHHHTYRKYRPSASRNYYHRIYPPIANAAALRRRLASSSSNYEAAAVPYHAAPSAYQSYYYGTGLASHPSSHIPISQTPAFAGSHGLAHASDHHDIHHEGKEVHSLLPIITVIGIGAFMIPLLTTFFTAMISSGGSCCQRQKERASFDIKNDFYQRIKEAWSKAEKAIGKEF